MTDTLQISHVESVHELVHATIEEGAAIMSRFDTAKLKLLLENAGVTMDASDFYNPSPENSQRLQKALTEHQGMAELLVEMIDAGIPLFNVASLSSFEFGQTLLPHVDNQLRAIGVSAHIPLGHIGDFAIHRSSHFTVSEFEEVAASVYSRITETIEDDEGRHIERSSDYGREDLLLLRQDMPWLGLRAKIHSVATKQKRGDFSEHRELISLDHALPMQQ